MDFVVALSRYHNILDAEDAWVIDYESVEPKETKPTKSAIRVRDLLETVTGILSLSRCYPRVRLLILSLNRSIPAFNLVHTTTSLLD